MADKGFTGLHHVAINVRDLDASVQWYTDVLGFAPLFPYDTDTFRRRIIRIEDSLDADLPRGKQESHIPRTLGASCLFRDCNREWSGRSSSGVVLTLTWRRV